MQLLFSLLLGHLLADFLLRSNSLIARKKKGQVTGYLYHGLLHYVAVVVIIAVVAPSNLLSLRFQSILLILTAVHLLIDWCKLRLTKSGRLFDGIIPFLVDQALHVITITIAVIVYARIPAQEIRNALHMFQPDYTKGLAVLVVYVATVFSGGYVVRYLTKSLVRDLPRMGDETPEHLQNAGMYIGWLERILILTAVVMRSPATIGLVLTAKSIVRYQEMKSGRFAEYFLIGTLLSIVLAIFGGIILLKVLHGTVDFTA
jgi:Protein of unknown function (DUF3307)